MKRKTISITEATYNKLVSSMAKDLKKDKASFEDIIKSKHGISFDKKINDLLDSN